MAEAAAVAPNFTKGPDGNDRRIVADSWYIGETLGKGGFGFVKMGYHKKNGKPFALKFIRKADSEDANAKQQAQLVATEINCLIRIQNPYVLKLFAYRTSCVYPQQNGEELNTIMLVLELARGGDLFDILYYTKKLDLNLARTYFFQLASGLKAIHDQGICHRDLKPQNLLLNSKFELKITDFGLSKIFEDPNAKKVMKTYYAGTQGYQAPEQILKRNFTPKCDVFSCGVILFILITGYPPCHNAHYSDPFYKYIAQVQYEKFWLKHRLNTKFDDETRDIMDKTLCYQPTDRFSVQQMLDHPWTQSDQKYDAEKLTSVMKALFKKAMEAKANDPKKMDKLDGASKNVEKKTRAIEEFGDLPLWEHKAIPRGRAFALKKNGLEDKECARVFLEFLDDFAYARSGTSHFNPKELKITLKITFKVDDPILKEMEKEDVAHVNVYKLKEQDKVFAVFEFPECGVRHYKHEEELYDLFAGNALPDWMDDLENEVKEQLHDDTILTLQMNDDDALAAFKTKVVSDHGVTEEDVNKLIDSCSAEPIEFRLPTLADWLIPRCGEFLDPKDVLVTGCFRGPTGKELSGMDSGYDDMADFFQSFNEKDPMGEFFKAAADADRIPTMETHGYVLHEE